MAAKQKNEEKKKSANVEEKSIFCQILFYLWN